MRRDPLRRLAVRLGVEPIHHDGLGVRREASPEALLAVLGSLGWPLARPEDASQALEELGEPPAEPPPAPLRAWEPEAGDRRVLGIFLPLHALSAGKGTGVGDLTDLGDLAEWAARLGARITGTLPLLASFLGEPFDPSPYAPVSRLFFNELYLDLPRAPGPPLPPGSRDYANHREAMARKRRVLERLAAEAWTNARRRGEIESHVAAHPEVEEYARFRAAAERFRCGWQGWPAGPRDGRLSPGDVDETARRTHVYAQVLLEKQIARLRDRLSAAGSRLYLDLPVGVNGGGYDAWRYRDQFAAGVSVGAPPDEFFRDGQDWGFPPLHPRASRAAGHEYFRKCLAANLAPADVLRLDHVMGLHRLYWIPDGFDADEGVYVRYPAAELFRIVAEESLRHRTWIVGENLGTVPDEVNGAMADHGFLGMSVALFEFRPDAPDPLPSGRPRTQASFGTHDTATFASFWSGTDIRRRVELGLLPPEREGRERAARERLVRAVREHLAARGEIPRSGAAPGEVLRALLRRLAAGPAEIVLVNLEDLWLEERPQNVPGITGGYPNFRRRAAPGLGEILADPRLAEILGELARQRGG